MIYGQLKRRVGIPDHPMDYKTFVGWVLTLKLLAIVFATSLISACLSGDRIQDFGFSPNTHAVSKSEALKLNLLLTLIEERLSIAPQVAKAKWNSGSAIDDEVRERRILDNVTAQATLMKMSGCNLTLLREFFQDQFDAGKLIQRDLFQRWRGQYGSNYKFNDAPDLTVEIRPKLDQLTPELITAYCQVQSNISLPKARAYLRTQSDNGMREDVDGVARRQALRLFQ